MTGPCHKGPVENQAISTAAQAIQRTASEPVNFTVYLRERMERMLVAFTRVTRESRAIEVNKGGVFIGSIGLTRVTRDALFAESGAGNLRVEALSLEFGHQLLAVFGKGFLLLFDVQPAAETGLDKLVCYAIGHSRLHHLASSGEFIGGAHTHCLLMARDVAAARIRAIGQARTVDVEKQPAFVAQAHASGFVLCRDAEQLVCGRDRRVGNVEHYADSLAFCLGDNRSIAASMALQLSRRGVVCPAFHLVHVDASTPASRSTEATFNPFMVMRFCSAATSLIVSMHQICMNA